ncbi:hypothetical protein B296_00030249 [Ensete ventricosum]|uniref:Uncharacterized protein n=1 Tax=Ensete ventricosum TaxID=4639 RepID=A0A426YAA8_ENSVE|nr:hypothetical protein B296_00030249 [Ensete ventricosum]
MIVSLTGYVHMCCIATNYSTTIRCTMSPPGDISIAYRFSCDELGLRLLYVWPLPTHRRASAIFDFWFAPLTIHLRPPTLGSHLDEARICASLSGSWASIPYQHNLRYAPLVPNNSNGNTVAYSSRVPDFASSCPVLRSPDPNFTSAS